MRIREIATARLKEYENNPRNNDLAVEKVKYSIERFGFLFPVIVDMNYVIVAGHTRVRACRELGYTSVPCIVADELTEEQINLFRLIDNKTSEYSDWDFEKLKNELAMVDLTLDKNQLLLERFELSTEAFDIEPEQAEIRIPVFNFMGQPDKPKVPADKKPTVSTVAANEPEDESEDIPEVPHAEAPAAAQAAPPAVSVPVEHTEGGVPTAAPTAPPAALQEPPQAEEPRKGGKAPTLIQFRFGDVSFFISQVELDRLNEKYAEYIDSGAMLSCSFVDYLLKGVAQGD